LLEQRGDLRQPALELFDGVAQTLARLLAVGAVKIWRLIAPSASC
jgi:hypothetical protein